MRESFSTSSIRPEFLRRQVFFRVVDENGPRLGCDSQVVTDGIPVFHAIAVVVFDKAFHRMRQP